MPLSAAPGASAWSGNVHGAQRCRISAANFVELSIEIEGQIGPAAGRQCDLFFRRAEIVIEPVTMEQAHRHGKPSSISPNAVIRQS
jgi:ribonuclease VapC